MDDMKSTLTALTGAVNRLLEQTKLLDNRLIRLEQGNDMSELKRRLDLLEQPGHNGVENPDEVSPILQAPRNEEDLKMISRLPDSVKELRTFDGNPLQYVSWVHAVEMVLKDFEIVKEKPIYRSIMQSIRQKIIGDADAALVSYNIFDSPWSEVKKVLSLHYADKRDIQTLEHQLNQLSQGSSKVDEFYSTVNHQLSLIINKLKTESYSAETVNALITTHRNRALDIFVRGLRPELSQMIIIQRPRTLPEAYSACLELQNLTLRNNILHTKNNLSKGNAYANPQQASNAPPRPPRTHYNNNQRPNNSRNNWHNKGNNYRHNQESGYKPATEGGYKPAPPPRTDHTKSQPMDVDRSMQTRKVDYMNRPRQAEKRSASETYRKDKQARLYHMDANRDDEEHDPQGEETFGDRYHGELESQEENPPADFDNAAKNQNFMEEDYQAFLT